MVFQAQNYEYIPFGPGWYFSPGILIYTIQSTVSRFLKFVRALDLLVSTFGISSKNDAERWGRELWSMSLARVPDPFNFYVSPNILVVSSQPPPGPLGRREHPPSAPGSFSCSVEWVGGAVEEMRSLSTRGGQRHLRKKFQIF